MGNLRVEIEHDLWHEIGDTSIVGSKYLYYFPKEKKFVFEDSGGLLGDSISQNIHLNKNDREKISVIPVQEDGYDFILVFNLKKYYIMVLIKQPEVAKGIKDYLKELYDTTGINYGFMSGSVSDLELQKKKAKCSQRLSVILKEKKISDISPIQFFDSNEQKKPKPSDWEYYSLLRWGGLPVEMYMNNDELVMVNHFINKSQVGLKLNQDINISPNGDKLSLKKDLEFSEVEFQNSSLKAYAKFHGQNRESSKNYIATLKFYGEKGANEAHIKEVGFKDNKLLLLGDKQIFDEIEVGGVYSNDYRDLIAIYNPKSKKYYSIHFFNDTVRDEFCKHPLIQNKDYNHYIFFNQQSLPILVTPKEKTIECLGAEKVVLEKDGLNLRHDRGHESLTLEDGKNEIVFYDDNDDLGRFRALFGTSKYKDIKLGDALNLLMGYESTYFKITLWKELFDLKKFFKETYPTKVNIFDENYFEKLSSLELVSKKISETMEYYNHCDLYISSFIHHGDSSIIPSLTIHNLNGMKSVISQSKMTLLSLLNNYQQQILSVLNMENMKGAGYGSAILYGAGAAILNPMMAVGAVNQGFNAMKSNDDLKAKKLEKLEEVINNLVTETENYILNELPLNSFYILENLFDQRFNFYGKVKKANNSDTLEQLKQRIATYEAFIESDGKDFSKYINEFNDIIDGAKPKFKYAV